MFIESLKIENGNSLIREIPFHKGLNLIIDETPTDDKKKSGNNVGKTTVLRLIDFCLGGKGENIYKDPEFKNKGNTLIEEFLKSNEVLVTLTLVSELDNDDAKKIVIQRNFLQRKHKVQKINEKSLNNGVFSSTLKNLVFDSKQNKPTFRQIIAKNIRDEKNRLQHTVKVLHSSTTQDEYESLYLYWFGIELDSDHADRKQKLISDINIEEAVQKQLTHTNTLPQVEQLLLVVNRQISELEKEKNSFDFNENYENELTQLNQTKAKLNKLTTQLTRLEMRKELIIESRNDLENEIAQIDTSRIATLYEEAKSLIPNIQRTFEETLSFHNEMVSEKLEYITGELPNLEQSISDLKRKIQIGLRSEKFLSSNLLRTDSTRNWNELVHELNVSYEQKGGLEESKRLWEESNNKLEEKNTELSLINLEILGKDKAFKDRITEFNTFFSDISSRLYNEKFVLSPDRNAKGYELNISSLSGNLGTGKKKGQIASFDLAYIQFADKLDINCLHFILHDQIENVHDNQISKLLSEIVSEINCQFIVPVLKDKLPVDIDVDAYKVLSLSQDNKLFKI
ncbi:DUF2326 domain-containing protein [Pseudoalteromonas sp. 5Ae-yellow]|uniref:DUF2326 domain-containing protein n=1 Tax=Pseudoalteromonas sp. 5Ae-yellow TaxID=2759847 RepID=UPI0015F6C0AB|nr:DUF2326 domain-containing protein [Pseudoalteromonas sp. 5Ae-yellow]MBA6410370.1 DUF2326 domain-containing protein [Pseudoalteromonas sp. 5Ae-yellow]